MSGLQAAELLETRALLTELMGIDFGDTGDSAPANWNSANSDGLANFTLTDLIDETATRTTIDLTVAYNDGSGFGTFFSTPDPARIPSHTNSLADIGGVLVDESGLTFTFKELTAGNDYEIFVFSGNGVNTFSQDVTITGATALPTFTQDSLAGDFVNDRVGSNASLSTFAIVATADGGGQIRIDVLQSTVDDFAIVPALAIREIVPPPMEFGELTGIDFGESGDVTPTNWNAFSSTGTSGQSIPDLNDETGAATAVDLTVSHSNGAILASSSPDAAQIPLHTNPLTNIGGVLVHDTSLNIQLSELDPSSDYQLFVFGGDPGSPPFSQQVTITGDGTPIAFVQSWDGNHFVNDHVASAASLSSFAVIVTPSAAGQITIQVDESTSADFAVISALAFRSVSASTPTDGLTVSIADAFVGEWFGPNATTATITRPAADGKALTVTLTSSDTTEITVPATVIIPAGQLSANVSVTAVDDAFADGTRTVTITASAAGFTDGGDSVDVTDDESPILLVGNAQGTNDREILESEGVGVYELAVSRNTEDLSGALLVTLNVTDAADAISVPPQVTIPAGAAAVTFLIDVINDNLATGTRLPRISGSAPGFIGSTIKSIYVDDDDAPRLTLTYAANSISEGAGNAATTATLTRNTPTDDPMTVIVSNSDATEILVPTTVTIAAGAESVTFDVSAVDDTTVDGSQTATISVVEDATAFDARLDLTFGVAGRVFPEVWDQSTPENADLMRVQPDGKILVLGHEPSQPNAWTLVRYNPDGSPDSGFGTAGRVTTVHAATTTTQTLRLLADGRIVVLGVSSGDIVARYHSNGSLDTTLDGDGLVSIPAEGLRIRDFEVAPDGSMFFISDALSSGVRLRKLNADGTLAFSVTADLSTTLDEFPVTIERQADGKLLVGGGASPGSGNDLLMLVRFNEDGTLDTSFGTAGFQTFDSGRDSHSARFLALDFQPDGKIVAAGYVPEPDAPKSFTYQQWIVARYNLDGTLDTSFSDDGVDIHDFAHQRDEAANTIAIQPDGSIVVLGFARVTTTTRVIRRYNADGTLDASFADNGTQHLQQLADLLEAPKAAALLPNGQLIVLSGSEVNLRVERYDPAPVPLTASAPINVTDDDVLPDLSATSFNAVSDHVLGAQTDVTFTIHNGGAMASGAFETHVVWSINDVIGDADDFVVADSVQAFPSLAAAASVSRTILLNLDKVRLYAHAVAANPAGNPVETVSTEASRLFLVADINNTVTESNESNNSGVGQLVDSDDITWFPWDKNGNGTVEPLEALSSIQAIGTSDVFGDFDGNGVVTPLEALSAIQRIGYVRNNSVVGDAPSFAFSIPSVSALLQATSMAPATANPVLAVFAENASPVPFVGRQQSPEFRANSFALPDDDEKDLFPFREGPAEPVAMNPDDDKAWDVADRAFEAETDWLSSL